MIRKILWTIAFLFMANVVIALSGYGIRLKEKPCTHLTGIGVVVNYITKDCHPFVWTIAVPTLR